MSEQTIKMPKFPIHGGCQCGGVRYQINAVPHTFYLCHCSQCRRQSGAGFGGSLHVPADGCTVKGDMQRLPYVAPSGRKSTQSFCGTCGNRILHQIDGSAIVVIKPGTLDDPSWLRPAGEIFAAGRQPWVAPQGEGALIFDDTPDMPALYAQFGRMIGKG